MKKKFFALCMIFVLIGLFLTTVREARGEVIFDIEEIVVTAARHPEPIGEASASVTVIDAKEIAEKGEVSVLEALRGLPGLDVIQSGGHGATTSIFLRGANSGHTLVLVDGVRVNSPTTGAFNFANLTVDNIERIEIVRGPQSTLYGSDAIGGVINIITKKGVGPLQSHLSAEGGSFNTYQISTGFSGSKERFHYSLGVSMFNADGISRYAGGTEKDGHKNTTLSARFGFSVFKNSELDFVLRHTDAETEIDRWGVDDPDRIQDTRETVFSTKFNQSLTKGWRHQLALSFSDGLLETSDPTNLREASKIDTFISTANWQHELFLGEISTIIAGIEWEEQEGISKGGAPLVERFDKSITNWGYYLRHQLDLFGGLSAIAGIRIDDHEMFGSDTNYQVGLAYTFADMIRLRGNWATGFKAPTFNDLFWPATTWSAGNPNLLPEESIGYDVGIDFWGERFHLGATYFHNDIENLIAWSEVSPWFWAPSNVAEAKTEGIEIEASLLPLDNLRVTANYTHTDTEDKKTGKELARRPQNKYGIGINYSPVGKANLNLHINQVGGRWDNAANTNRLDSYTRVDLAASYDWTKNLQTFARADNIFNEKYEEAKGFGAPGASIFIGAKVTF